MSEMTDDEVRAMAGAAAQPAAEEVERPDRDAVLAVVARLNDGGEVTSTAMHMLATSLLDIAQHAMSDTYLASDSGCQLARAVRAVTLRWAEDAYWEDTCGDCIGGRCHWGGETSQQSIAAVAAGEEYVDPTFGKCGCARHTTSAAARAYRGDTWEETALAWQAAKDAGEVVPAEDDSGMIWVSRGRMLSTLEDVE